MRNVTIFIFITIFSLAWAGTAQAQTCDTSWENPVDGSWTDGAKWTAGVPSATTVACIEVDGDYEVSVGSTNTAKALVLGPASGTGTPALTFSNGTLTLIEASIVRSTGQLNWSGGTLDGTLTNEGLLRLASGSNKTLSTNSELVNDGTIEHEQGLFILGADALVDNTAGATFDSQADVNFSISGTGSRRFENNGTFVKSGGTGISTISGSGFDFDNLGTVHAQLGEIRLGGDGTHTSSAFMAQGGAEIRFSGGTHTIVGGVSGTPIGLVRVTGGTIAGDGSGATLAFDGTGLSWEGGSFGGMLTNEGLLRLASGSNKTLSTNSELVNDGTIEHEQGLFILGADALVDNTAGATFDSQADVNFSISGTGSRRFENNGLFVKTGSTGGNSIVSTSGFSFDNNGTVDAEAGEIRFSGGDNTHDNGVFEADVDAVVNFLSGSHTIVGSMTGTPAGLIQTSAVLQDDGSGGVIDFGGTGLSWEGGSFGGTLTNEGLLRLASGSNKTLSANSELVNEETIEHEQGLFILGVDALVDNTAGATFDSQADVNFSISGTGSRRFENNGLFVKTGSTGGNSIVSTSGFSFDNFGTVRIEEGEVRGTGPFLHDTSALIEGVGTFNPPTSNFTHAGDTGPGLSPGVLNWTGTFNPQTTATFIVDIAGSGGAGATNGHDQLVVSSSAALDGQIQVNLDSFVPTQGQQFEVLTASSVSGVFSNPNTNDQIYAGNGVAFTVIYESNWVLLVADLLEADIALEKTVSPAVVDVGETAIFTVTASKDTDADDLNAFGLDEDIVIEDILPSGLILVNATASAGTYNSTTGEWLLPVLLSGGDETLTLEVTVDAAGIFENTAELRAAELPDPDDANDSASATVEGQAANLALEKTVSDASVLVGDTFSFTVTLTNNGPNDASGIEIADAIPNGLTCDATAADGSYDADDGLWTLGSLAVGALTTLDFACTADEAGEYTNVATRQASSPVDLDDTNDEAEASINVTLPATADLALEKTVSPSSVVEEEEFEFLITLTNNGPEDATDIVVLDDIPDGLTCTPDLASDFDTSGQWTVSTLANGTSAMLTLTCTADEAGEYTNVASIQGSNPTDPDSDNDVAQAMVTVSEPDCLAPKSTQDASTVADGFITLTFTSADGLVEVNFVDPSDNARLVNFEASTEADFTSDDGISWSFAGTEGSEPEEVVFILTAVPPPGLEPGDPFTASYFVQVKNVCGSVLEVDPVLTLSTQAPRALAILGNYPNPFGDATTIRFDLPEAGDVQVQVFDLMGREVATLVDAPLSAGTHEVTWNGALSNGQAIASGLYLVRLQAGGQTTTQRMTRVR